MFSSTYISDHPILNGYFLYLFLLFFVISFAGCNDAPSGSLNSSGEASFDALSPSISSHSKAIHKNANFPVFDEIRHFKKPKMKKYGLTPIEGIYSWNLWGRKPAKIGSSKLPAQNLLAEQAKLARKTNPDIAMIDIEHWPTTGRYKTVRSSILKYAKVYKRLKRRNPKMKLGYFGVLPIRLASGSPKKKVFYKWRKNNNYLKPLANKVDAFFVPAKTHWKNYQAWARSLKLNIHEARRMANGKPVYVVLDPQYPRKVYGAPSSIHNKYIEAKYWRWQLNQTRRFADGVVIWSHYGRKWKKNAPWWKETKRFLRKLGKF